MADFVSELALRLPVDIDANADPKWRDNEDGQQQSERGYVPRDFSADPLASGYGAKLLPQALLDKWPRESWKARIEELERTGQDIPSILRRSFDAGIWRGLNQDPTNYCWCYGVAHNLMVIRLLNNEPFLRLSPYSVACIVKNFRNIGGWGSQANAQACKEGMATEQFWPMEKPGMTSQQRRSANMNAINNGREYLAGSRANAALKTVKEWYDLPSRSWEHKMACLCEPLPVASGYNRIGHERCTIAGVVLQNGGFGMVDLDSYTNDGSPDLKVYSESFGAGEDMVVSRASTPSDV